ncbi:ABC transporter permease [Streptomyces chartreusis]|uniref:ABC transporter permease n=1 Tax=Streptomyces chartreusis TaxID=1969 RepID=UPI0036C43E80
MSAIETPTSVTTPPPARRARGLSRLQRAERFGVLGLLLGAVVLFSILMPRTFASVDNFQNIATSQAIFAIVALAIMIPLVGGRFDVSVGSLLVFCTIASAAMLSRYELPLPVVFIVSAVLGAGLGLVNGLIVAYLGVNSIIATLGTGTVMTGLVQAYTGGVPINQGLPRSLTGMSSQTILGVPVLFLIMCLISVAVWFLLTQTPYGRRLLAVGSNLRAARLTGLDVRRMVTLSFVGAGCVAGIGGVLQLAAQGSGDPAISGLTFILPALAAVFLGATTWRPGTYNVPGTLLGLFFVGTTVSGLTVIGVAPWVTDVFNGAAVVVAIVISAQIRRRRTGELAVGE